MQEKVTKLPLLKQITRLLKQSWALISTIVLLSIIIMLMASLYLEKLPVSIAVIGTIVAGIVKTIIFFLKKRDDDKQKREQVINAERRETALKREIVKVAVLCTLGNCITLIRSARYTLLAGQRYAAYCYMSDIKESFNKAACHEHINITSEHHKSFTLHHMKLFSLIQETAKGYNGEDTSELEKHFNELMGFVSDLMYFYGCINEESV